MRYILKIVINADRYVIHINKRNLNLDAFGCAEGFNNVKEIIVINSHQIIVLVLLLVNILVSKEKYGEEKCVYDCPAGT